MPSSLQKKNHINYLWANDKLVVIIACAGAPPLTRSQKNRRRRH